MLERATRQVNGVTQVQYVYRYNGDQERVLKIGVGGSAKTYYVRGLTDVLSEFGESASGPVWSVD
jgi:hypothetical protein